MRAYGKKLRYGRRRKMKLDSDIQRNYEIRGMGRGGMDG
jgi:hypothetical protein